jgi:GrpB-like predicted nucleotidyltransferase (UPF0157 family)
MSAEEPKDPKTTTDDELRAMTVGELKPLTGPIVVSDDDPAWPRSFEREAARIRSVLGDRVKLLEHAGSTSVPGLPAKPISDIVLAVYDFSCRAGTHHDYVEFIGHDYLPGVLRQF